MVVTDKVIGHYTNCFGNEENIFAEEPRYLVECEKETFETDNIFHAVAILVEHNGDGRFIDRLTDDVFDARR